MENFQDPMDLDLEVRRREVAPLLSPENFRNVKNLENRITSISLKCHTGLEDVDDEYEPEKKVKKSESSPPLTLSPHRTQSKTLPPYHLLRPPPPRLPVPSLIPSRSSTIPYPLPPPPGYPPNLSYPPPPLPEARLKSSRPSYPPPPPPGYPPLPLPAARLKRSRPSYPPPPLPEARLKRSREALPKFHIPKDLRAYATAELGIAENFWPSRAALVCEGDEDKLCQTILSSPGLLEFMFRYPKQFKDFLQHQLGYWLLPHYYFPEEDRDHPSFSEEEEVMESYSDSIFLCFKNSSNWSYSLKVFALGEHGGLSVTSTTLGFLRNDKFPQNMGCVKLGSFIYFIGGMCKIGKKTYSSKMVYALDLVKYKENPALMSVDVSDCLCECKKMNVGKSNPLVMVAKGKIYVLSCPMMSSSFTDFPDSPSSHLDEENWTFMGDHVDWYCGGFEVYDPTKNEWTILPLPHKSLPDRLGVDYPSCMHDLDSMLGYAVVNDKLFVYCWFDVSCVYTFDIRASRWKYYNKRTCNQVKVQDFYDSLVDEFLSSNVDGRGFVFKDTLYTFSWRNSKHDVILGYHIPCSVDDEKSWHKKMIVEYSPEEGDNGCTPLKDSLIYLRDGIFGYISSKVVVKESFVDDPLVLPSIEDDYEFPPLEEKKYLTLLKVKEKEERENSQGKPNWCVDMIKEFELIDVGDEEIFVASFAC